MTLSPEYFVGTRKLEVCGVVRGSKKPQIEAELERALAFYFPTFRVQLDAAVTENNVRRTPSIDAPLLFIAGWPKSFTPDFSPQATLAASRTNILNRAIPSWQVALVDPDSRLLLRPEGPNTVHRPFTVEDYPKLATNHQCSFLLTGGDERRAARLKTFVDALLKGQLRQLPADWHFMPSLP
jgi:hypothetical protein